MERSSKNTKIPTGEIEVIAKEIEVLGKCKNILPFEINTDQEVREDLRLEYRFLDLRNEKLHNNILLRSKILKTLRDKMDELGFAEIQTPILANSSPEGARDFLVPSTATSVSFGKNLTGDLIESVDNSDYKFSVATHGHLPTKGDQPPFILSGPDIKMGVQIQGAKLVDEAPTIMKIYGIVMEDIDGHPLDVVR